MEHKGILSSAFNMSLGFVPVIISILLCELITQDTAIYIGTGIGIVGIYLSHRQKGVLLPNFILYIATGVLSLLSLAALIPGDYVPPGALPLTLEVGILIPMLSLYMHKRRFINYFLRQIGACKTFICPRSRSRRRIGTYCPDLRYTSFYHYQHYRYSPVSVEQDQLVCTL